MKMRNVVNYELTENDVERPVGPSVAVPDETLTIRQIFEKFANGNSAFVSQREGIFDPAPSFDSEDLEKANAMDPVEKDALLEAMRAKRKFLESEIKSDQEKQKARKEQLEKERQQKRSEEKSRERTKGKAQDVGDKESEAE